MSKNWIYALLIIVLVLTACAPLGGTLEVGVISETQETTREVAPTAVPSTPTPEPNPDTGVVMGKICYPSEFIPSLTAYFQNNTTGEFVEMPVAENQAIYSLELEPGEYVAFAYPLEAQSRWAACIPKRSPAG